MSTKECPVRHRLRVVSAAFAVSVGLVALAGLMPMAYGLPIGHGARPPAPAGPNVYTVISRSYHGVYAVNGLVSLKTVALVDLIYSNNSEALVLFNAATNTSKVVQSEVPGGTHVSGTGTTTTGGAYLVAFQNLTSGKEFWEKVATSGKITTYQGSTLPVNGRLTWSFPFGNQSTFFATSGHILLQIDPSTMRVVANYTNRIPNAYGVTSALPLGQRLYLAGDYGQANGATAPYFGYLDLSSNASRLWSITNASPGEFSGFDSLIAYGGNVYAGGYVTYYTASGISWTVMGYFYEFVPGAGAFLNLSSLLPMPTAGVFALEPWGSTIALSLSSYLANGTLLTTLSGGIYTFSPTGLVLNNQTAVFPKGYLAYIYEVTAASGGWYFSGGFNSVASCAEVVAVKA